MQNQNLKKITALVAMLATVFVLLFSTSYLIEHAEHNCTGSDCPICAIMEQCGNNLKTIITAIILACIAIILFSVLQETVHYQFHSVSSNSLISQKVRMNN